GVHMVDGHGQQRDQLEAVAPSLWAEQAHSEFPRSGHRARSIPATSVWGRDRRTNRVPGRRLQSCNGSGGGMESAAALFLFYGGNTLLLSLDSDGHGHQSWAL